MSTLSVVAAAEPTEVDAHLRTAFDLTDVCGLRLQCYVATPAAGARLVLHYSLDNGSTWQPLSVAGTGPFVLLSEAGSVAGAYVNVAAEAATVVLLSPFIQGGDDSSVVVLGNVNALALHRTDDGVCAEYSEASGCSIPLGSWVSQEWSTFADYDAWVTFASSQPFVSPTMWAGGFGTAFDESVRFGDERSLKVSPANSDFFLSSVFGYGPPEADDLTLLLRFKLDAITHNDTGDTNGYMVASAFTNRQYINLLINNTDRLSFTWRATWAPVTYATVDVGPASVLFGEDRELLMRFWFIDASTMGCRIYVHVPCETPVLLYEKLDLPSLGAPMYVRDFEWMWQVSYATSWTVGDLWFYQTAIADDPSAFGLTP